MKDQLYSAEQVADLLGLQVRTVRGYVRSGTLKAVRIGKQYRISQADLEEFTGHALSGPREIATHTREVDVSCIVEVTAVDRATTDRISTLVTASAAHRGADSIPLRIETAYDEERARLKIIVLGGPGDTAAVLGQIEAVLNS